MSDQRDFAEFESMLTVYRSKADELDEKGGPQADGRLFEEIMMLEERLLAFFDLPQASAFVDVLQNQRRRPAESIFQEFNAAGCSWSREDKDPVHILEQARAEGQSSGNVLPRIGVETHIWNDQIYDFLMRGQLGPEQALRAFHASDAHLEVLGVVTHRIQQAEQALYDVRRDVIGLLLQRHKEDDDDEDSNPFGF